MESEILSLQPQPGWVVEAATAVRVESGGDAPSGTLLARVERLVLRRVEEGAPLTLALAPSQPCQLAALSVTLNARFLELYSEDVYSRTVRGKATESRLVFEIGEEFAPPMAVSGGARLMCKVASIKGDAACVTLENLRFSFVGLRAPIKPAGGPSSTLAAADNGAAAPLPFSMPMMAAAVESIKQELRSSILEDLRIMLEGQSMIMMSKFAQMERRLNALDATVQQLAWRAQSADEQRSDAAAGEQAAEEGEEKTEETKG